MSAFDDQRVTPHPSSTMRRWLVTHPLSAYLVITYLVSWAYWIPLALGTQTSEPGVWWPSQMPGLTGPAVSATIVTALISGKAGLAELWQRLVKWRVAWWWLSVVAILLAGAIGLAIAGGVEDTSDLTLYNGISASIGPLATIALVFLLNGVGEEVGWRGFLADRLLRQHSLTVTALLVALVWALWHAPIFFLLGSFKNFTIVELVGWVIGLTAGSFVLTWLYRGSRSSILLVAVWHTAFNFTSAATPAGKGLVVAITSTLVMIGALAIIVADWRLRRAS
jgi:membrane protease YdiL (CAAX protease family)